MPAKPVRLAILAPVLLGACHVGAGAENRDPGPETRRNYQLDGFTKVAVSGPYEVEVTTGRKGAISAVGGANLLDETEVVVEDGTLRIKPKSRLKGNWTRGKAVFTVPAERLSGATIAGSGGIRVDRVSGDFSGEVAGSGALRIAEVRGGTVELTIAGSGDVSAAGRADRVDLSIAGSGDIKTGELVSRTAKVSVAGSGNVDAHATDQAEVSIMGSGDVRIAGGARCDVSKHGSGNVTCE